MPIDVSEEIKKILSDAQAAEQRSTERLTDIRSRLEKVYTGYAEYLVDQDLIILKLAQEILKEKESKNLK